METIGDGASHAEKSKLESIEYGIHLDEFKTLLLTEEEKLKQLEERRQKLEADMDGLERAIIEEKQHFREIFTGMVGERRKILDTCAELKCTIENPSEGDCHMVNSKQVIDEIKSSRINLAAEIDGIEGILAGIETKSKDEYMQSIKSFLAERDSAASAIKSVCTQQDTI
jgi:hypothetical protein